MTAPAKGSSLLQSPERNLHQQPHPLPDGARSLPRPDAVKRRDVDEPSIVAQVIQTVELIQVVDPNGVPITVHTVFPPATTRLVDSATADIPDIIDTSLSAQPLPPVPTPADSDDVLVDITLDISSQVPDPSPVDVSAVLGGVTDIAGEILPSSIFPASSSVAEPIPDEPTANLTITSSSQDASSSSTPLPTTIFPTLTAPLNGTRWNATLFSNSTRFRNKSNRTSSVLLTTSESTTDPVVLATPPPAPPADVAAAPQPVPEVDHQDGLPDPPPTSAVVGISVGSIAGAALIVFVIMALIRWKRRNGGKVALGDGLIGNRGLLAGGTSGGNMTQQSLSSSMSGVLASLPWFKQQPTEQTESHVQERSFYRVSGRKLPSVFDHGGDGYTDPRQSILSTTCSDNRDSQLLDAEGGAPTRLAVGSPMRPVSGIPIMRSGPARTPITEVNPFSDPPTPPPVFRPDPLGRSLTNQDGSRVSSRFAEEV